jgi:hypothetical protein
LAIGKVGHVGGEMQILHGAIALGFGDFVGAKCAVEGRNEALLAGLHGGNSGFLNEHLKAVSGTHFGDAGTHEATPDNSYALDVAGAR